MSRILAQSSKFVQSPWHKRDPRSLWEDGTHIARCGFVWPGKIGFVPPAHPARLEVDVLGPLVVRADGRAVTVGGGTLTRLLHRLVLDAGTSVSTGDLVDDLWDEQLPANPRAALQSLVARLRKAVGGSAVEQTSVGYRLEATRCDVEAVRNARAQAVVAQSAGRCAQARDLLAQAIAHVRGPAMPEVRDLPWARAEAAALDDVVVGARVQLAEAQVGAGQPSEALAALSSLITEHPGRQDGLAVLLRAAAAAGRPTEGLAAYERTRRRLADELGLDPIPAVQELHLSLLRGELPANGASTKTTTAAEPSSPLGGPPRAVSSFVGRDGDLARLERLLASNRLVTVIGPGGAGKTRTALEVARRLTAAGARVGVVELAAVTADSDLDAVFARDLRLPAPAGMATTESEPLSARLLAHLRAAPAVVVVDNCEHLVDAAAYAEYLLQHVPELTVLATTREALAIDGEVLVPLSSLPLPAAEPDLESAATSAAVRLFVERASAASPGFTLDARTLADVVSITRRLDGLPLALELAAARLRVMSLRELASGLDDRFTLLVGGSRTKAGRHRTLRALVQWSWELLSDSERIVLERLSVFAGGGTRHSVRQVCADRLVGLGEVSQALDALVEKSLVVALPPSGLEQQTRYSQLETIREYGLEQLVRSKEMTSARQRHARHYLALARRVSSGDVSRFSALESMVVETENLEAALVYLIETKQDVRARAMILYRIWPWMILNQDEEVRRWVPPVLALGGQREVTWWCVTAIGLMGDAGRMVLDAHDATVQEMLRELGRHEGEHWGISLLLSVLLHMCGQHDEGRRVVDRGLDRIAAMPERHDGSAGRTILLSVRAMFAQNIGDLEQMRTDVAAVLDEIDPETHAWTASQALASRSYLRGLDGDLDGAIADARDSLRLGERVGGVGDRPFLLPGLIQLLIARGDLNEAEALVQAETVRPQGSQPDPLDLFWQVSLSSMQGLIALARGDAAKLSTARTELESVIGRLEGRAATDVHTYVHALAVMWLAVMWEPDDLDRAAGYLPAAWESALATDDQPFFATVGSAVALVAYRRGHARQAAAMLGAADSLRGKADPTLGFAVELTAALRQKLGPQFEARYDHGRALNRSDAIARLDPATLGIETGRVGNQALRL